MQILKCDRPGPEELFADYYYRYYFYCSYRDCKATIVNPEKYKIWNVAPREHSAQARTTFQRCMFVQWWEYRRKNCFCFTPLAASYYLRNHSLEDWYEYRRNSCIWLEKHRKSKQA